MATTDLTGETTEILQQLIRNECVNDGTVGSGHEVRSVDLLESYLRLPGVEIKRYEPQPGRASLVLRIEGSDPKARSLHLMGHTDVVPVTASGWKHDPFGGELIDGEVWGRGAVDMLDVTGSMAVAVKRLLQQGFRPKGTLIFSAVADEEALGTYGAQWLTENAWDDVKADFLVTEFGGTRLPIDGAPKLPIMTAEKGSQWTRLRVKGTPGHGSMPYQADNALIKASEVITKIGRYKAPLRLHDLWKRFIEGLDLPAASRVALMNAATFDVELDRGPAGTAPMFYAATRTTFSPNMARSGVKLNVIPDSAEIDVDIRTIAGDDREGVRKMLRDAIGEELWKDVEIVAEGDNPASDARFFRRRGVVAYGYGLLSDRIPFREFAKLFHGNNERVDQESLRLTTELWEQTAREFLA
ncbi:MAG: M20/M25/M40 family metallo-hydrolase [Chloroflexi bacterium]|nr:MAG: M20/M25/M40 family metallo-hydrolase [Chloroflexota bacterium]